MRLTLLMLLVAGLSLGAGCTSPETTRTVTDDTVITVEGTITLRGNEPFTTYVLETEDRNSYVLTLDELPDEQQSFTTPVQARVTGALYADTWGDQPYAHLRVTTMEEITDAEFQQ